MLPYRDFKVDGKYASLAGTAGEAPQRVVSLVPSTTESLFVLGLGKAVAGVTDFCIHPADQVRNLPRVGGTKNPRLEDILALQPDLVITNQEENTPELVRGLEVAGLRVLLQFPKTVDGALESLYELAAVFRSQPAMLAVESLARSVDYARAAGPGRRTTYFCPIWYSDSESEMSWWMTFNRETFPDDLLGLLGGENVFSERQRRYPLKADLGEAPAQEPEGRDTRYPRVTDAEITATDPEIILLPSEPFAFDEEMKELVLAKFSGTRAVRNDRVSLVDGSLITWHGVRMASALRDLPGFFNP